MKMSAEEKDRLANQRNSLGEEGLKEKAEQLEKAMAQNKVFIPLVMSLLCIFLAYKELVCLINCTLWLTLHILVFFARENFHHSWSLAYI